MGSPVNKDPPPACARIIEEITKLYKSLPARPSLAEVEAANVVLKSVEAEQDMGLKISQQEAKDDVPTELYSVLQQVRKAMVLFNCQEQRKEAIQVVELDKTYQNFDELIHKAQQFMNDFEDTKDLMKQKHVDEIVKADTTLETSLSYSGIKNSEKYRLMKVASIIENAAQTGARVVDLHGKLMDKVEWLPMSLGKMVNAIELNLSDNHIMALPTTIGNLRALTKLDLHSNQIINLPDSFGELFNLADLNLHGNRLKLLPDSFKNLINLVHLDLSSNRYANIPDFVGKLTSLKSLNMKLNELEELPYTIGFCASLVELRLDFNRLKALPEAVGMLECLEILTLHFNRIRGFPTTIGNLSHLRELDVSFNEVGDIPETFCFAVSLEKLNLANNFADLRRLPTSIGSLENLEELDISNSQIRILPDSFRFLSKLKTFRADETPLQVPSRQIIKLGAQAVVESMAKFVAKNELQLQRPKKRRYFYSHICSSF